MRREYEAEERLLTSSDERGLALGIGLSNSVGDVGGKLILKLRNHNVGGWGERPEEVRGDGTRSYKHKRVNMKYRRKSNAKPEWV